MSEPYIAEIRMFGGNFAPKGWAFCNGQLLSIAQNTALFSILGTTYGGDGITTFGLPNLQGRVPMHWGTGAGLTPRTLGEMSGSENVTLLTGQMPAHTHALAANSGQGDTYTPQGTVNAAAVDATQQPLNIYSSAVNTTMAAQSVTMAGGGQPHANMQPFQCVSFIMALEGIYPSRS